MADIQYTKDYFPFDSMEVENVRTMFEIVLTYMEKNELKTRAPLEDYCRRVANSFEYPKNVTAIYHDEKGLHIV